MSKRKVYTNKNSDEVSSTAKWGGIVILFIMIFSIAGFAMLSGGGNVSSDEIPDEIPLQQFDNNGQVFWGAIRNGEQFIFMSIEGYDGREDISSLASSIKSKQFIELNVAKDFVSDDSIYLIEKALNGIRMDYSISYDNSDCNSNSLVLTLNQTLVGGDCMFFSPNRGEEIIDTDILVYHLIK